MKVFVFDYDNTLSPVFSGNASDATAWHEQVEKFFQEVFKKEEEIKFAFVSAGTWQKTHNVWFPSNFREAVDDRVWFNLPRMKHLFPFFAESVPHLKSSALTFIANFFQVSASSVFFFDDMFDNVALAASQGFQTILVTGKETFDLIRGRSW